MQENEKHTRFWKGAISVTLAALLAKVLSAAYRVPYQNLAGDLGFYVYQQIYPFYGFSMILAMYGFPVVLSKMISEQLSVGKEKEAKELVSVAFISLLVVSVAAAGGLFVAAPTVAFLMGDVQLQAPLRAVGLTFLLVPFLSVGRGLHQAQGDLQPTALSHIVEQFVRVSMILILVSLFLSIGGNGYQAGIGAAIGSLIGGVVAIVVLFTTFRTMAWREWLVPTSLTLTAFLVRSVELWRQSLFICGTALVFVLFQLIDAFSMIRLLEISGVGEGIAQLQKGVYDRGQPLIQLGTVLATTFSLAIVPLLARAKAEGRIDQAIHYGTIAFRLTVLVGGASTIGLLVIMEPTNGMLFIDREGSNVLRLLSISILFGSIFMVTAAVLQGLGYAHLPIKIMIVGLTSKGIMNVFLVPWLGTYGAAVATTVAFVIMAALQLFALRRLQAFSFSEKTPWIQVAVAFLGLTVVTAGWRFVMETFLLNEQSRLVDAVLALSSTVVGGIAFLYLVLKLNIIADSEWAAIPKLHKWKTRFLKEKGVDKR
ncbi:putative polysaccharide biosynthesis protein [Halalkalibacterium ligniniphilum]|uniref:putative polysaccharide biosynthesis protein n=1 Tax=Halalkalibacterium ligniniphilum TaxID=1134413 RepID=UPI000344F8AA|nr:polysaccharide biosynthesis protein [Halalkalibacterium ligniniphilum]